MGFLVGIDPYFGKVAVYNPNSGKTNRFQVATVKENDNYKVEIMFKKIKSKINGDISWTYIALYPGYANDIRIKIIEAGKNYGFFNCYIIDLSTLSYLYYITEAGYKPKPGEIICTIYFVHCIFWEISTNSKAKSIKYLKLYSFGETKVFFTHVKKEGFGLDKDPSIIIYTVHPQIDPIKLKKIYPECRLYACKTDLKAEEVALIKAMIMANYVDLLKYDIEMHLDTNLIIKINGKEIMSFEDNLPLPLQKTIFVPIENNEQILKVIVNQTLFSQEIKVSPEMLKIGEIEFTFIIDENRIFSTNVLVPKYSFEVIILLNNNANLDPKQIHNNAIGIDLGTSRSCAAVARKNGIEPISLENTGGRQLLSYVGFNEEKEKCGEIVKARIENYAKSTVFDSKRIIGKSFDEIKIEESWPFKIIDVDNKPMIQIQKSSLEIIDKHPDEIAAVLLKHIKEKADEFQGRELIEVVITVPATFSRNQKFATCVAATLAGWKNVNFLFEPIAASIAYFIDKPIPPNFILLLFDLGGGTLDISIFEAYYSSILMQPNKTFCSIM